MLPPVDSGEVDTNVPSLTSECSIPLPNQTANRYPPAIASTKKRAYEQRIREVEHSSFTPLVLSLTGGMGPAATVCFKRLASMIAMKRDQSYSKTMCWLICSLNFALLRSSIQCLRGARSSIGWVWYSHVTNTCGYLHFLYACT